MKVLSYLIKPASSSCNLRCRYCFYEKESATRDVKNRGMLNDTLVTKLIEQSFLLIDKNGLVSFAFQGGEPTLVGLDWYKRFVKTVNEYNKNKVRVLYSIQTNGFLINDEWAVFLHDNQFLTGLSIDGYKEIHDMHRIDVNGNGTYNTIVKAYGILKKYDCEVNVLTVVTKAVANNVNKVYKNLKSLGFEYLQFIACMDPIGKKRGEESYSLLPETYGKFLISLFDLWYKDYLQGHYKSIRLFDDYIHILLHDGASTCATCGICNSYIVVEGDGTCYPCDFYCTDDYELGSLKDMDLKDIIDSSKNKEFLEFGSKKPKECYTCEFFNICHGGCKNDWVDNHNYYCRAFKMLFAARMDIMYKIAMNEAMYRRR